MKVFIHVPTICSCGEAALCWETTPGPHIVFAATSRILVATETKNWTTTLWRLIRESMSVSLISYGSQVVKDKFKIWVLCHTAEENPLPVFSSALWARVSPSVHCSFIPETHALHIHTCIHPVCNRGTGTKPTRWSLCKNLRKIPAVVIIFRLGRSRCRLP